MSSRHQDWDPRCKVYVGNLGSNAARGEIEEAFSKYGTLRNVWVARNPPGFAFVEFEDPRDAEDAVRALDGVRLCGARVKVEMSTGKRRSNGFGGDRGGRGGDRRGGGGPPARRGGGYSPRRSRSRSRDRFRDRKASRSVSRDRVRRDSRSRSRSPSYSKYAD
ncbi:RNA-binding protein 1-like [Daphnia pulex]|uniref:RRM domain-containing protein n=4 Tax=Daphnia TaxID=6668 RepID=E9GIZ2_DAPPU|nr:RNA-binding protein 1 [Daphnia magna]XP_046453517.1 RNA-binding protein 1-like [Daphnia pulex]XP_046652034.1 RNA-binding protein 1-like [Daphnia pulicaria]KAI9554346.1 hypothetical protein GHT06_019618 [Daphnia sinensis]EFX80571.1 hypothetical protein DAPPUDRAFT_304081 [Daphnia pulex]KAK4009023.1 hypothetical protein OUZ56_014166 [Daphnia magna]KZS13195.1 RNA-binding protein 1 [Daphnia magna]|eukprot:EFX80571.1 hypothetical protein DAPPUDRAFT_304081 [Daphnia pulex]